jgi:methylmalonyl-CoA/ethylmalonyl-CoA epimerase
MRETRIAEMPKTTNPRLTLLQNGISQVCLIVEDLDKAVEAYWKWFGIGPWYIYTYGKPLVKEMTYRGEPGNYRMRLALARLGPIQLELVQPLEGGSVYAEAVEKHGYGLHHLGILVEDLVSAVAQAEAAGLTVTMTGAGHGLDGDGGYAYLDTENEIGTTLELFERPRRRVQPDKIYPPPEEGG